MAWGMPGRAGAADSTEERGRSAEANFVTWRNGMVSKEAWRRMHGLEIGAVSSLDRAERSDGVDGRGSGALLSLGGECDITTRVFFLSSRLFERCEARLKSLLATAEQGEQEMESNATQHKSFFTTLQLIFHHFHTYSTPSSVGVPVMLSHTAVGGAVRTQYEMAAAWTWHRDRAVEVGHVEWPTVRLNVL
jgi:hypothetical protein